MAWTASTEWERWDPQKHVICPFDSSHRITAARFQRHLVKCRKNFPDKDFVSCPFNATHQILRQHLRNHICQCPDKNVVEATINNCYKDSESLDRLRGNTSVPSYHTPGLYDVGDEDWDAAELWPLLMNMSQHAGIASYVKNTINFNVPRPLVVQYVYNFKKSPAKVASASDIEIDIE